MLHVYIYNIYIEKVKYSTAFVVDISTSKLGQLSLKSNLLVTGPYILEGCILLGSHLQYCMYNLDIITRGQVMALVITSPQGIHALTSTSFKSPKSPLKSYMGRMYIIIYIHSVLHISPLLPLSLRTGKVTLIGG